MACPAFVNFVEAGITTGPDLLAAANEYLEPLKDAGVDTVVLGCTHYPLLTGVISFVMGEDVTLVSSAEETAKDVYRALANHRIQRTESQAPSHEFIATGDATQFETLARRFLGPEVLSVKHVDHVAAQYPPTGSLARITPEMLEAARSGAGGLSRRSYFVQPGDALAGGTGTTMGRGL